MADNKKTILVTQQVKELVFDIQNKAHLTGRSREIEGKSYEVASNIQASDNDSDDYQIRRSLSNAFSGLKVELGEFLSQGATTSENLIDEEIDADGELLLVFELPSNYNTASAESIGNGIHSYLVEVALSDWFSITDRDDAAIYLTRSSATLVGVKRALYMRNRPDRPTYN